MLRHSRKKLRELERRVEALEKKALVATFAKSPPKALCFDKPWVPSASYLGRSIDGYHIDGAIYDFAGIRYRRVEHNVLVKEEVE